MKHKISTFCSFLLIIVFSVLYFKSLNINYLYIVFAIITFYLVLLNIGIFNIKFNYFLNSIQNFGNKNLYLTFDDGPDPKVTPKLLDILRKESCKASFFLIGKNAEKYPEIVTQIYNEGHTIGNHTYSHSNSIAFFSKTKLKDDIKKANEVLEKIISKKVNIFRIPVGISNPRFEKVLKELKLISVAWSIRTYDTKLKGDRLKKRLNLKLNGGEIILFHDTIEENLNIIEDFIKNQKKDGKIFANLSELTNKTI